jgi:hypothetical protein
VCVCVCVRALADLLIIYVTLYMYNQSYSKMIKTGHLLKLHKYLNTVTETGVIAEM